MLLIVCLSLLSVAALGQDCLPRDKLESFGTKYNGTKKITASGAKCMTWQDASLYLDDEESTAFAELQGSFCRALAYYDHYTLGPWCFVAFNKVSETLIWEPCFLACEDADRTCVKYTEIPIQTHGYLGERSKTKTSYDCVPWNSVSRDKLPFLAFNWKHQECRSVPFRDSHDAPYSPWCFTSSSGEKWDYCFFRCHDIATCMDKIETTLSYSGSKSISVNKRPCAYWSSPKNPLAADFKKYSSEDDRNYCRNFGRKPTGPFCLIEVAEFEKVKIEPCFEHCTDLESKLCVGPDKMLDYWGSKRTTISGLPCQRWASQVPNKHSYIPTDFNVHDLWEVSNFCRNPDASLYGPWCFTATGNATTESCFRPCSGDEIVQASTEIPDDDQAADPLDTDIVVENKQKMPWLYIIAMAFMGYHIFCLGLDICIRQWVFKKLTMSGPMKRSMDIIEAMRPGKDKNAPVNKLQFAEWGKLIDVRNVLKKKQDYAIRESAML